jgi:hypothetical protein
MDVDFLVEERLETKELRPRTGVGNGCLRGLRLLSPKLTVRNPACFLLF